ncbi:MAG: MBOAT family protein [Treponemataceae bacterium]|nr:MBOAT family protein [Treponemataceae bacterium]
MLFNSWQFIAFFAVVGGGYILIANSVVSASQLLLLAASLYFYASWNPWYLFLLLFSVLVTWKCSLLMEAYPARKKLILVSALVLNLAILFFFKYYNFFSDMVQRVGGSGISRFLPSFSLLLPVGISFYTFQVIGYVIDVYRGTVKAEKNLLTYTLFVTFFPQLVAGPIERSSNLLPQFKEDHRFDYDRTVEGLLLATWGLFKKVCIADRLAFYVDKVYGDITNSSGIALLVATVFFAFQILCDFSGYSDMAIGIAKVLGFNLMRNFRHLYFSKSIAEFWRRWHISLSTWFKDYVYIPLGGNRVSVPRNYLNLVITFFISGLWHGAAMHFVVWGLLHGMYQVAGKCTRPFRTAILKRCGIYKDGKIRRWWQFVQMAFTFALVCFGWIVFRAPDLGSVAQICRKLAEIPSECLWIIKTGINEMGLKQLTDTVLCIGHTTSYDSRKSLVLCFLSILILFIEAYSARSRRGYEVVRSLPVILKWFCYFCLFNGAFGTLLWTYLQNIPVNEFVYFQF